MIDQSVYLVGSSASNFAGSACMGRLCKCLPVPIAPGEIYHSLYDRLQSLCRMGRHWVTRAGVPRQWAASGGGATPLDARHDALPLHAGMPIPLSEEACRMIACTPGDFSF
jgi:hypothetical protein